MSFSNSSCAGFSSSLSHTLRAWRKPKTSFRAVTMPPIVAPDSSSLHIMPTPTPASKATRPISSRCSSVSVGEAVSSPPQFSGRIDQSRSPPMVFASAPNTSRYAWFW